MNIIVYYPKTEKNIKELSKKTAGIHNQAVLKYIQQLPCPNYQKQALITAIQKDL